MGPPLFVLSQASTPGQRAREGGGGRGRRGYRPDFCLCPWGRGGGGEEEEEERGRGNGGAEDVRVRRDKAGTSGTSAVTGRQETSGFDPGPLQRVHALVQEGTFLDQRPAGGQSSSIASSV